MSDADVAEGVFGTGRCRKLETSPVVARIAARKAPLENRGVPFRIFAGCRAGPFPIRRQFFSQSSIRPSVVWEGFGAAERSR